MRAPMEIKTDAEVANWDATWTYRPAVIARPETVDDIIEVLTNRERFPSPVRPAGSRHSTARVNGDDGGTIIDMTGMNRILKIERDRVTVEGGAEHLHVSRELRRHGLQLHITTEIGNTTLAAMAVAASKDASFPGEYGQINSYVTGVRLVTPKGEIREITEDDNPQEMRLVRSSYGLTGVVFEVTIRCKPTQAIAVRHVEHSLAEFKAKIPEYDRAGNSVMYYLFPYKERIIVELRKYNPHAEPKARLIWAYRNLFWRKYGPAMSLLAKRLTGNPAHQARLMDFNDLLLRRGAVWLVRSQRSLPHAQTINYPQHPGANKYVFSMWSFPEDCYFEILERYFKFCQNHMRRTGYRADIPHVGYRIAQDDNSLLSYSRDGMTMSIDPASTGGEEWEEFLLAYNKFCSAEGGIPLLNQTPFLKPEQVRKAFGERVDELEAYRRKWDPENRMLDSYFREMLTEPAKDRAKDTSVVHQAPPQ